MITIEQPIVRSATAAVKPRYLGATTSRFITEEVLPAVQNVFVWIYAMS
jgi:hypothetical protein